MSIRQPSSRFSSRNKRAWKVFAWAGAIVLSTLIGLWITDTWSWMKNQVKDEEPALRVDVAASGVQFQSNVEDLPEFVIPRSLAQLTPPPGQEVESGQRYRWAYALGGVDANTTSVDILIQGSSAKAVVIKGLRVHVKERHPPLAGTHITYGPIGEFVPVRTAFVDLNNPGRVELTDEDDTPLSFPLAVSEAKVEALRLTVLASNCDCTWSAELVYLDEGQEQTTAILRDGQPFRTTASTRAVSYYSNDGRTFQRE
jgi:hypothetical protein